MRKIYPVELELFMKMMLEDANKRSYLYAKKNWVGHREKFQDIAQHF